VRSDDMPAFVIPAGSTRDRSSISGDSKYTALTHIGKSGLERKYEDRLRGEIGYENVEQKSQKFLICVLKNDPDPIRVDARVSDRSRSITLLHVGETP